ncbi:MAG: VWA domain-containing protein [bacterium]|nr:VWA domain-containing protein [bacterium]
MVGERMAIDLGAVENYNNDTVYYYFTNSGSKTVYFLPIQPGENYQVLCSNKTIIPGDVFTIGLIYYTEKKGRFNIEVPINFSNSLQPIILKLSGQIKSIHPNALTICPSIENSKPLNNRVPLNIVVRDKVTYEQIKDPSVNVIQNRRTITCVPGFRNMAFQCNCEYGRIKVNAEKEGYMPATMVFDYNQENNTCLILIERLPVPSPDTIQIVYKPQVVVKKDTLREPPIVYIPTSESNTGFNETAYKPNHLIFVIDVSGSMKDTTKLPYLKSSLKALIEILRPQDFVTLITYSSKTRVVFENVNGQSKTALLYAIDTLTARGASLGAEGLNLAYEMAHQHFIVGGNNQIFLATDGLFNGNHFKEEDLFKKVKQEATKSQIRLTTIAFGKTKGALEFLSILAFKGKGKMLRILNLNTDKDVLIEEVKSGSVR